MSESPERLVARLTELARKAWPNHADVCVEFGPRYASAWDEASGLHLLQVDDCDRFEAALCALAGEAPRWATDLAFSWRNDERCELHTVRDCVHELLEAAKGGAR